VRTGDSLNQIRFVRGDATVSDSALQKLHGTDPLLFHNASPPKALPQKEFRTERGLFLRIDLTGSAREDAVIGYRAKKNSHVIDLAKIGHYAALDFWEPLKRHRQDSLLLEPEEFYILASKERIRVPPGMPRKWSPTKRPAANCAPTMPASSTRGSGMETARCGALRSSWKSARTMSRSSFMTGKPSSK
jgi:hypothetical protein